MIELSQNASDSFLIEWSGEDPSNGSGIATYTLYVSEDGVTFTPWLENTTETEAIFTGEAGNTYSFYTVATDNVGNSEKVPTTADATITLVSSNTPPVLFNNLGLTLDEAAIASITSLQLEVTDSDNTPDELLYSLTDLPNEGILLRNSMELNLDDTFTQADINNGVITYSHNGSETINDSFSFTVTDGNNGNINETLFNITINPVDDLPIVQNAIADITVDEDAATQTIDVSNVFFDADRDPIDISFDNSNSNLVDVILDNNLLTLDYVENQSGFALITLTGLANGETVESSFMVTVNAVQDDPTDLILNNTNVDENQPIDTTVGTFSTIDPDRNETFTYDLVAGEGDTDNSLFTIEGNSLTTQAVFDFETQNTYSIRVQTTDSANNSYVEIFTISINDVTQSNNPFSIEANGNIINYSENSDQPYANQDFSDDITFDNDTAILGGNTWKALGLDYNITPDTILSFDFKSNQIGEIQGLGFDDDLELSQDKIFNLYGSQNTWGIRDFTYTNINDWQQFEINLGSFITGDINYLILTNDDDANANANSQFRNLVLSENPSSNTFTIDVNGTVISKALERYGDASVLNGISRPQDTDDGIVTYTNNGNEVKLENNAWKAWELGIKSLYYCRSKFI